MTIRQKTRKTFAVGVDLGWPPDGTAIAVVERVHSPSSPTDPPSNQPSLHLRYLKRFPPGTSYPDIARSLSDLVNSEMQAESKEKTVFGIRDVDLTIKLAIDQTSVGSSVVDMILEIVDRFGRRVVIAGYHTQRYSDGHYIVPKQELISLLQARLGTEHLKFAKDLAEVKLLVDELIQYQDRKTNTMRSADAWREHPSDDLVFAVALACWVLKEGEFGYEFL
jgi:hypothetical protein